MSEGKQEAREPDAFSAWFTKWCVTDEADFLDDLSIKERAELIGVMKLVWNAARQANQPQEAREPGQGALDLARSALYGVMGYLKISVMTDEAVKSVASRIAPYMRKEGQAPPRSFHVSDDLEDAPDGAEVAIIYKRVGSSWEQIGVQEPQGKAQPDSGEIGQEVDRWPLCCQESYDFGFQMGKVAGAREMAEKAAQLARKMKEAAADVLAKGHDTDAAVQHDTAMEIEEAIRSLASAEPPQLSPEETKLLDKGLADVAAGRVKFLKQIKRERELQGEAEKEGRT